MVNYELKSKWFVDHYKKMLQESSSPEYQDGLMISEWWNRLTREQTVQKEELVRFSEAIKSRDVRDLGIVGGYLIDWTLRFIHERLK